MVKALPKDNQAKCKETCSSLLGIVCGEPMYISLSCTLLPGLFWAELLCSSYPLQTLTCSPSGGWGPSCSIWREAALLKFSFSMAFDCDSLSSRQSHLIYTFFQSCQKVMVLSTSLTFYWNNYISHCRSLSSLSPILCHFMIFHAVAYNRQSILPLFWWPLLVPLELWHELDTQLSAVERHQLCTLDITKK